MVVGENTNNGENIICRKIYRTATIQIFLLICLLNLNTLFKKYSMLRLVFACMLLPLASIAQPDESQIKDYLRLAKFDIDTSAKVVILYESVHVDILVDAGISKETREIHQVMRIMKKDGLKEANIKLRTSGNDVTIKKIRGTTYNLEGGELKQTDLPKDDLYKTDVAKNRKEVSFTMPDVKEGSIIDYSLSIVSPINDLSPEWRMQNEDPKLYTQFSISYPATLTFTSVMHVKAVLKEFESEDDAIASKDEFCHYLKNSRSVNGDNYSFWARKNVKGIKNEPFVLNLKNHTERLTLQLSRIKTDASSRFSNTWDAYNTRVWNSEIAKSIRRPNNFLNETVAKLVAGNTSRTVVAKNIYSYVRSNFVVNKKADADDKDPEIVFEKKEGTASAINTLLAAMLNKSGLTAYLLMVSTLDRPSATEKFPMHNSFNHIACALAIDNDGSYVLLDAGNKHNVFGMLPVSCYNGYSRIITEAGDAIDLTPQLIVDRSVNSVKITFPNDSTENVEICRTIGMINSHYLRQQMTSDKFNRNSYFEKYIAKMAEDPKIRASSFENVDNPDTNIVVKITFQNHVDADAKIRFINTSYIKTHSSNPFTTAAREFPIEFACRVNDVNQLSIEIPSGYEISDIPKSRSISTGEGEMEYSKMVTYLADAHLLKIAMANVNNKTVYSSTKKEAIRKHYDEIIKEENKVIELKRK